MNFHSFTSFIPTLTAVLESEKHTHYVDKYKVVLNKTQRSAMVEVNVARHVLRVSLNPSGTTRWEFTLAPRDAGYPNKEREAKRLHTAMRLAIANTVYEIPYELRMSILLSGIGQYGVSEKDYQDILETVGAAILREIEHLGIKDSEEFMQQQLLNLVCKMYDAAAISISKSAPAPITNTQLHLNMRDASTGRSGKRSFIQYTLTSVTTDLSGVTYSTAISGVVNTEACTRTNSLD